MIFNPFWITLTELLVMPGTSSTSPVSAPDIYIYIYIYIYCVLRHEIVIWACSVEDNGLFLFQDLQLKTFKCCYLSYIWVKVVEEQHAWVCSYCTSSALRILFVLLGLWDGRWVGIQLLLWWVMLSDKQFKTARSILV